MINTNKKTLYINCFNVELLDSLYTMKKYSRTLVFAVCSLLAAVNMDAREILIDVEKAPSGYTSQMQVHYWGSGDAYVNATKLTTISSTYIWIATIPDDATGYQVCRGSGSDHYNYQTSGSGNHNQYHVTGWDNSGYWDTWTIGNIDGGMVYFDNSKTKWSGVIQFVIGHNTYSRTYVMSQLEGTSIWYVNLAGEYQKWTDATYYAFICTTSKVSDGDWGMSKLSSKAPTYRTAPYTVPYNNFNLSTGNEYLGVPSNGNNTGATITMSYMGDKFWQYAYLNAPTATMTSLAGVQKEVVEVCKQSIGDPFSLQPKIKDDNSDYDYNQEHQWYKYTTAGWVALSGGSGALGWGYNAGTGSEDKLHEVITSAAHTYYFLAEDNKSKARFIDLSVTLDCATTSKITNFDVVTSTVNAHDSTYILDGIVAFEDELPNRVLRITVTDGKGTHTVDSINPKTPCVFSLSGCFADGSKGVVATAQFLDKTTMKPLVGKQYTSTATFDAPNAITGITTTVINSLPKSIVELKPAGATSTNEFVWNDGDKNDRNRTIPTYDYDTTVVYVYYEYEPAPEVGGNLIENSNFSAPSFNYGTVNTTSTLTGSNISNYNYWGTFSSSYDGRFYDHYGDLAGGMAVVENANKFWMRYTAKVQPKSGDHFALFDADNTGSKQAWFAHTKGTINNPELKLKKGTNYMFSFWVANINNYGEMNNAAILQFEIRYKNKKTGSWTTYERLGEATDLNNYPDNLWHQNSFVYTAKDDADEVQIAVRDLNTHKNKGGNDFALDDIQFAAISVRSQAVRYCERFVVNYYESPCTMNNLKITSDDVYCGGASSGASLPIGKYNVYFEYDLDDAKSTDVTVTDMVGGVVQGVTTCSQVYNATTHKAKVTLPAQTADGLTHTYYIKSEKLDGNGTQKGCEISGSLLAPKIPTASIANVSVGDGSFSNYDCSKSTYTLTTQITYTNQAGKLYVWLDNDYVGRKEITGWTANSYDEKKVDVVLDNLLGDTAHHQLNYQFNDPIKGCAGNVMFDAPYIPKPEITSIKVNQVECKAGSTTNKYVYSIDVNYKVTNGQGNTVIVEIDDGYGNKYTEDYLLKKDASTQIAKWHAEFDLDATNQITKKHITIRVIKASAGEKNIYSECETLGAYTTPQLPTLTVTEDIKDVVCNTTTYKVDLTLNYTAQQGNLQVRLDDETNPAIVDMGTYNPTTEKVTIDVPADNSAHSLFVKFTGDPCGYPYIINLPAKYSPKLNSVSLITDAPTKLDCNTSNAYDVEVRVNVANILTGTTIYARTTDQGTARTESVTIPSVVGAPGGVETITEGSYDIKFSNLKDVNDGTRTITIYIDGFENCANNLLQYTTPLSSGLQDFTTSILTERTCSDLTYSISGTINFDSADGTLIVEDANDPSVNATVTMQSATSATFTISGLTADNRHHYLNAYFSNNPTCKASSEYDAPSDEIMQSVVVNTYAPACDADKYRVVITATADRPHADIVITDNGVEFCRFAAPAATVAPTAGMTFVKDTMLEIAAKTHLFEAYMSDMPTCKVAASVVSDPVKPMLKATATQGMAQCSGNYMLDVNLQYTNQNGTLNYQVDNNPIQTATYTQDNATQLTLDLPAVTIAADGSAHGLHIWFDGTKGCDTTILLPAISAPMVSIDKVDVSEAACDDPTYSIELTITSTNTSGAMTLTIDGQAATYTLSGGKYIVSGLKTTGKKAVAVVASWAASGCNANITYDEPLVPHLGEATIETTTLICGQTTYDITVSVVFSNTKGALVISDNGTELANTDTVTLSPFVHTFTGLVADGVAHNLAVQFGGCTQNIAYTAPQIPTCNAIKDTICHDEWKTYSRNGFTLTTEPKLGLNTYTQGFDSLYLYVEAMPQLQLKVNSVSHICEDMTEIRLPIEGTPQEVASLAVTIDDSSAKAIIEGTDVVVILPSTLTAGEYKVTIEALNNSGRCSSEPTEFTLSFDHKGLLYRKWNDVLFVNNRDSLFAAYQWYHNGKLMDGEIYQCLYDPNGLSGLYYCEMTTTEGEKWQTCEEDYASVQRSADVSKQETAQILPNPVRANQDITILRTGDLSAQMSTYTITGELVGQEMVEGEKVIIRAPKQTGVYLIRIDGQTLKLIVK